MQERNIGNRGPNLVVGSGVGGVLTPLRKYIEQKGIKDEQAAHQIRNALYNYRHRNNHTRRVLTQSELAYMDQLIRQQAIDYIDRAPVRDAEYITLTDYLEQLIGKKIKHETYPLSGTITSIDNTTIEINFNGTPTILTLDETDGLLIQP
jgi:hypothetical protein